MSGFPQPPITQWRIIREPSGVPVALHINDWETVQQIREGIINEYTVLGRRRLNDYVGSPIWSDWETLERA